MPRDGAYWLAELTRPKIEIECECGLKRRYDRLQLLAKAGDWSMPALLDELAKREGCAKARRGGFYDRCQVRYLMLEAEFLRLAGRG